MIKKLCLLTFIVLVFVPVSQAQDKLVNKANKNYKDYSFSLAIDIYKRVLDKGYVSADLLKKLGNSYYFNGDYSEASEIYQQLLKDYPESMAPDFYFRYAQTLRSLGELDKSRTIMAKFSEMNASDVRVGLYKTEADYFEEIAKNSGRYQIGKFKHNSKYSDFAPTFYKQGLLFASDRDTGNFSRNRHTWTAMDFLDLYKVNVDSASQDKVLPLGKEITTRLHESTTAISKDGKTLYFTRNNYLDEKTVKNKKGIIRLKLFKATKKGGEWTAIKELPFNSDSYSVAHPTLSPDEKTLYFASDMPGTYGQSDIFKVAIHGDGSYGPPINLGESINTEARESFPFVSSENILYFSSDGHPGLGGLDVFAVKIADSQSLGKVINVGEPINSNVDDFTFIIDEETKQGYFASNRKGGVGGDDIYSFTETKPLQLDYFTSISGIVRDKITNEVLVGARVKVIDETNEEVTSVLTNIEGYYTVMIDGNTGNFIRALMDGYVPAEEYLPVSEVKPSEIDFYLEPDYVTGSSGDDLAKLLQLGTIYFDFDKYSIRSDAEVEIQKIIAAMEKYPSLKLKVTSHTDSQGRDSYNLWLSHKRAEATTAYMKAKGIAGDRLLQQGFGETKLVNKCGNGVKCSQEEHQMNRRSEFLILE